MTAAKLLSCREWISRVLPVEVHCHTIQCTTTHACELSKSFLDFSEAIKDLSYVYLSAIGFSSLKQDVMADEAKSTTACLPLSWTALLQSPKAAHRS
jgi:hypothetical protein